jgi:hypothetical protein
MTNAGLVGAAGSAGPMTNTGLVGDDGPNTAEGAPGTTDGRAGVGAGVGASTQVTFSTVMNSVLLIIISGRSRTSTHMSSGGVSTILPSHLMTKNGFRLVILLETPTMANTFSVNERVNTPPVFLIPEFAVRTLRSIGVGSNRGRIPSSLFIVALKLDENTLARPNGSDISSTT